MEYNPILLYIELGRRRYLFSVHTLAFYVALTGRTLGSVRRCFSMLSHLAMAPVSSAADWLSHCPFKCARTYGDTCRNHSVQTCVYLLKRGNTRVFNWKFSFTQISAICYIMSAIRIDGGSRRKDSLILVKKKTAVIPDLIDGSGLAASDTENADLLARAISSQCSSPHRYTSQHTPAAFHDTPFHVPQLTGNEVFCALRTLPAYKATCGTIPNRLIKETAPVITESLCYLFHLSLSLGQLPNDWKIATVVPLLKPKGFPSNPVSYRPISLLPCIAKVLDHLVCNHISAFLYRYKIITPAQYVFFSWTFHPWSTGGP